MEANVMLQSNVSVELSPAARPRTGDSSSAPAQSPRPMPVNLSTNFTPIEASSEFLNAQSHVSRHTAEDLVSFSMPYNSDDISESTIRSVVDYANEALAPSFFKLDMSIHEATNMVMVSVVDTTTNEVLREIPPESRLDIMAKLREASGLLFDAVS